MKDEEIAENFANSFDYTDNSNYENSYQKDPEKIAYESYLAGLKAGRPQWHDLRKDPNDLPDTDRYVWVKRESEIECQIDNYYEDDKGWGIMFREGYCTDDVIAWCELPTFDKE